MLRRSFMATVNPAVAWLFSAGNLERMVAIALSVIVLLSVSVWTMSPYAQRVLFVALSIILTFLVYPAARGRTGRIAVDGPLITITALSSAYLYVNEIDLVYRMGAPTFPDLVAGLAIIIAVLEATRRTIGWPLVIIALGFLAYAFLGPYFPGVLSHKGTSIGRLVTQLSLTFNGIFGVALRVMIWFVFLFVVFGAFLDRAGAIKFFSDFACGLVGRAIGGQAKLAVVASGLMGMILAPFASVFREKADWPG